MTKDITHVGLDAHQETIHAAVLVPGSEKALENTFANTPEGIRRWVRQFTTERTFPPKCVYRFRPFPGRP
jgi:hypothetical protein